NNPQPDRPKLDGSGNPAGGGRCVGADCPYYDAQTEICTRHEGCARNSNNPQPDRPKLDGSGNPAGGGTGVPKRDGTGNSIRGGRCGGGRCGGR
ncbi:MAG: hypothetical protein RR956_08310, partial [Christensenella sp.]